MTLFTSLTHRPFALMWSGQSITGWATKQFGAPAMFVGVGALTAALAALGLTHPAIRNLGGLYPQLNRQAV